MITPFSFAYHEYLDSRPLSACNEWCPECSLSPKFKRVSLNETFEFPFWGVNICVDFYLRDSKKMENMKKLNIQTNNPQEPPPSPFILFIVELREINGFM